MTRILCPVLVGRDAERERLDAAADEARRGGGGVTFVSGPAGIGKSRLVAEAAGRGQARGMAVLQGRSVPSRVPVPYRPLAEALLTAPGAPASGAAPPGFEAALGAIVPAWRDEQQAQVAAESPVVVAQVVLRTLAAVNPARGCLLLLEDLHWADPETLHAVEYLADHAAAAPVRCFATLRDDPGTEAAELLARLDARRAAEVIRLRPLPDGAVAEMARRSLGSEALPDEVGTFLHDHAEGTPFLVEELLAAAVAEGALLDTPQGWTVAAALPRVVPQSFAATVRARLAALDAPGRAMLATAALLGRSFDWRLAARAAGTDDAGARALLDRAVVLQLLAAHQGGLRFCHALTREAILDELLPAESAALAARALDALEAGPPPSEEWRHLAADLAETAGEPDRAAAFLLQAGRSSLGQAALDTAAAALERAAGIAQDPALRASVLEALAETRSATGELRRTAEATDLLLDSLARIDAPPARRGNAHLLLARCAVTAAQFGVAGEELARARRLAACGDAALGARAGAVAAQLAIGEGRIGEAEALAVRAAEEAAATAQPGVVCEALEVAARCARTRDLDEAQAMGVRALQAAEDAGLAYWRMRALYQLGVVAMFRSGDVEPLRRAREAAERLGAVATATSLDVEIAAGLEAQHRTDEARATCLRCIEMAHLLDLGIVEALAHAFLAILDATRPSRRRMEQHLARATELVSDPEITAALWGDVRAVASLAAEDRARASTELDQAVALYPSPVSPVPRLATALRALVVAVDGGHPDFAAAAGTTRCNCQAGGYLTHAEAVVAGRAGRAAEARAAVERGGALLAQMPWYRHLCRRLVAEAAIADGWGEPEQWLTEAAPYFDAEGNERLAAACRALLRRAGARVARPTRAGRTLPAHLRNARVTPREADVLALVGEGLSNRAIAERLHLSDRTVEQHVGVLKQKLGMQTRAQLAVFAAGEAAAAG
jgi:DNA-binding CsgD family transcriptional regulator